MAIDPKFLSFDELLQKRLFEIPEYQRAYSWTTKQRKDLFSDIEKLYNYQDYSEGVRNHFMATVVCCTQQKIEEFETDVFSILDIVDGQQRITTLIILLKAIHKKLVSLQNPKHRRTILNLEELLVKDEDNRLILIQTNHSSSIILREYLISGTHPTENKIKTHASKNLEKAFIECEKFVDEWSEQYNLLDLLILMKNRLFFILHILDDEGSVYTVFEVLNSRGLEVDWLDKCKSMLMGIAFEKLRNKNEKVFQEHLEWLHKYWSSIYESIGISNVDGTEIVRFACTLFHPEQQSRPLKAEEALEFFRSICNQEPEKVITISKWLLDVTQELEGISANPRLKAVTKILQARLVAVAINLSEHFDNAERKKITEQWEKVTFKIFGLFQKDSRFKVGEYTRLAHYIMGLYDKRVAIDKKYRYKKVISELIQLGDDYPIKKMIKELAEKNCYSGWEKEIVYFFYRYEEFLYKSKGLQFPEKIWEAVWNSSINDTIEHIYPQKESYAWEGKIRSRKEFHANRIGNLLILPRKLNSKIHNNGFADKKIVYKDCEMLSAKEVALYKDWDKQTIGERTQKLLEWAAEEWEDVDI